MTRTPRYRKPIPSARSRSDIVRQLIAGCLLRAISQKGGTNAAAAGWLKISERTIYSWLRCERPVSVEMVLACPQLAKAFRVELCVHDHGLDSVPYMARARRGSK